MRRRLVWITAPLVACLVCCTLLTDADDLRVGSVTEDEPDAEAPPDVLVVDAGCGADLATDPKHCGRCDRDCLGGSCVEGKCTPVTVATGLPAPYYLAQDATHLYVTSRSSGHVYRVVKDGSTPPERIFERESGRSFAVTVHGDHVYASDLTLGLVFRVPKAGGASETIAAVHEPADVVVDDGFVWFTSFRADDNQGPGRLERALLDGGARESFSDPLAFCEGLAIDERRVVVGGDGTLKIYPKDGGASSTVVGEDPRRIVIADGTVYLTGYNGNRVWRLSNDGLLEPLAEGMGVIGDGSLAVDETSVYWTTGAPGGTTVYKASNDPRSVAPAEVFLTGERPIGIVLDDRAVYVAMSGSGTIVRVAR